MREYDHNDIEQRRTMIPEMVMVVQVLILFLSPLYLQIHFEDDTTAFLIISSTWLYWIDGTGPPPQFASFYFDISQLALLPYSFFRIVFIIVLYRYYTGLTTKKRTILCGALAEIQLTTTLLVFSLPRLLISGRFLEFIWFPIPIQLIVGMLFIVLIDTPQFRDSFDDMDPGEWWVHFDPIGESD